jgi:hypothetical protein
MTLIINLGVGGLLTAVTSDTRQVAKINLGGITKSWQVEDAENKASKITNCVMFAGGGYNRLVDRVKVELEPKLNEADDLITCHEKLCEVIDEVVNQNSEYDYTKSGDDYFTQILITGFTADGQSGHSAYDLGSGEPPRLTVIPKLQFDGAVIAPSEDHMEVVAEHMGQFRPQGLESILNDTVGLMAGIQQTIFQVSSEDVSETCNYSVLYLNPHDSQLYFYEGSLQLDGNSGE